MYYNPGVTDDIITDQRHRHRPAVRLADGLPRPPELAATATRSARRCRMSPARTISRPASRTNSSITNTYYQSQRQRELHVPQRRADSDHPARHSVSFARRAASSTWASTRRINGQIDEQADAEPRPALGLLQQLRARKTAGFADETDGFARFAPRTNPWIAPRTFDPVNDVPNWKDWNPRLGASYDLFGNGGPPSR